MKYLITGGTGFLGQALVKRIMSRMMPKEKVIVYSRDEFKQSEMARELDGKHRSENVEYWLGDVRDLNRLKEACEGVDIIIHTAALKRMDQKTHNAYEVIDVNVRGTKNVCEAGRNSARVYIVSSDKAYKSENIYGASKFCAEGVALAYDNTVVWRFGNFIDSRGSVFEIFKEQRDAGVPLTITDPNATRFIMSVEEAVNCILRYEEHDGLHYPENLKSMTVKEIADSIAPGHPFVITGLREGEKLFESFSDNYNSKK